MRLVFLPFRQRVGQAGYSLPRYGLQKIATCILIGLHTTHGEVALHCNSERAHLLC